MRQVRRAYIATYDAHTVLIRCICCLANASHRLLRHKVHLLIALSVVIVVGFGAGNVRLSSECVIEQLNGSKHTRSFIFIGLALGDSHSMHLLAHANFVPDLVTLGQLSSFLALPILFVDLLLEGFPHGSLLHFTLVSHHGRLVATISQNVAVALKLEIYAVLEHSTSDLHLWKVLLRDACVKVSRARLGGLRHLSRSRSVHVERAIVGRIEARLGRCIGSLPSDHQVWLLLDWTAAHGAAVFLLLTVGIALFDLPLKLGRELTLTCLLIVGLPHRILMQTRLCRQLVAAYDAQVVLVAIMCSRVNCLRRVHHGLNGRRIRGDLLLRSRTAVATL